MIDEKGDANDDDCESNSDSSNIDRDSKSDSRSDELNNCGGHKIKEDWKAVKEKR